MLIHLRAIKNAALALAAALSIILATSAEAQQCGPTDVVFIVDETGSMSNVINEIQTQVGRIASEVITASASDFQFGLIGMPDNNVRVLLNMTPNDRQAFDDAVQELQLAGGCGGVPYDEALAAAIDSLPARTGSSGAQLDPFTATWRPNATKIIILITDTLPQSFTCSFEAGVHDVAVNAAATKAAAAGIRIAAVYVPTGNTPEATIKAIMEDAAIVSGGIFKETLPDASDLSEIIVDIIQTCGGGGPAGAITSVFVEPRELVLTNGQSGTVRVINFAPGSATSPIQWSASGGLDSGITFSFSPINAEAVGTEEQQLVITAGPDTPQGTHFVVVRASREGFRDQFAIIHVIVECRAPFFLGRNQLRSQSVTSGSTARLRAQPSGDGPLRYQWYRGNTGHTAFPVAGATSAELVTGPITEESTFWVRVRNACGSRDSATVVVTPTN